MIKPNQTRRLAMLRLTELVNVDSVRCRFARRLSSWLLQVRAVGIIGLFRCGCCKTAKYEFSSVKRITLYTMRYDIQCLTCAGKLTESQLNLTQGTKNRKIRKVLKQKLI